MLTNIIIIYLVIGFLIWLFDVWRHRREWTWNKPQSPRMREMVFFGIPYALLCWPIFLIGIAIVVYLDNAEKE